MGYTWNNSGIIIPSKKDAEEGYRNERRKGFINDIEEANRNCFTMISFEYPKWLVDEVSNAGYEVDIIGVNSGVEYSKAGEFDYVKGYISWI